MHKMLVDEIFDTTKMFMEHRYTISDGMIMAVAKLSKHIDESHRGTSGNGETKKYIQFMMSEINIAVLEYFLDDAVMRLTAEKIFDGVRAKIDEQLSPEFQMKKKLAMLENGPEELSYNMEMKYEKNERYKRY